jgi:hypothetical protein
MCFVQLDDRDLALTFYREALGLEVRNDPDREGSRRLAVGASSQPGTSIVLELPATAGPVEPDDSARSI